MCDRLAESLEQLRHTDRLATVGKLASGLAHELGTPLNVIAARAEMIATGETSRGEMREYARVIMAASDRMSAIVRQLLQFARRRDLEKTREDLRGLAEQTIQMLRPLAAKRSVELEVEGTGSP